MEQLAAAILGMIVGAGFGTAIFVTIGRKNVARLKDIAEAYHNVLFNNYSIEKTVHIPEEVDEGGDIVPAHDVIIREFSVQEANEARHDYVIRSANIR